MDKKHYDKDFKDTFLNLISQGRFVSIRELMEKTGKSKSYICNTKNKLTKEGYNILSNNGYMLESSKESVRFECSSSVTVPMAVTYTILSNEGTFLSIKDIAQRYPGVSESSIRRYLKELEKNGLVLKKYRGKEELYGIKEGRNALTSFKLDYDDIFEFIEGINDYRNLAPEAVRECMDTLYERLRLFFRVDLDEEENEYYESYDMYKDYVRIDSRYTNLEKVKMQFREIMSHSPDKNVLRIRYKNMYGYIVEALFETGLIIYAADKDMLYLIGKDRNKSEFREAGNNVETIIQADRIELGSDGRMNITAATEEDNPEKIIRNTKFCNEEYKKMCSEMISVSVDIPIRIKAEITETSFENIYWKFQRFSDIRSSVTDDISVKRLDKDNSDKVLYIDKVRGVRDIARFLRTLGPYAYVTESKITIGTSKKDGDKITDDYIENKYNLRKIMMNSSIRLLESYKEYGYETEVLANE